jgi:sortase A
VVDARDVEILWDAGDARLTLVTCFPFDAVVPGGPLRYVVRAARLSVDAGPASERPTPPSVVREPPIRRHS